MKRRFTVIIWVAVISGCIVLGIWQRQNLSIFWREYHCLWRDYKYQENNLVRCTPLISEDVVRSDPEAAAIVDMMLLQYDWSKDERLSTFAENLLQFPNNEYFLLMVINEIYRSNELDQEVALKLAEKLIELDKGNSLYHYLKAAFLLANRRNNDITPVLDEINTAASYTNFYFPYSKYHQRAVAIAERASLRPKLVGELSNPFNWAAGVHSIDNVLMRYAHRAFTDGEVEKGMLISDAINSIGKNQLDAGHKEASDIMSCKYNYLAFRFGNWYCPEILELQRADITEERARQNRLKLCPYALSQETEKRNKDDFYNRLSVIEDWIILVVPIALYNGRMFLATVGVCIVLAAICIVRGWSGNQKAGFSTLLLFGTVSLCYFFLVNGRLFNPFTFICTCYFVHPLMMRPEPLGLKYIIDLPTHTFVFLICPVLAALFIWLVSRPRVREMTFWKRMLLKLILAIAVSAIAASLLGILMHFSPERIRLLLLKVVFIFVLLIIMLVSKISKSRFAKGILAAMPLGVLTAMASSYAYIPQILSVLFVLICMVIILNKPSDQIPFMKALRGVFGGGSESAAIRVRAIKLLAPFIIIHWLFLAASVPIFARYIKQSHTYYPKSTLAPADETSYQEVLARFDSNDFKLMDFWKLMPLVMPEDLPTVINTTKNKGFTYPNSRWSLKGSIEQDLVIQKLNDGHIITAMQGCGRDVTNILTDAMENPEQDFALVSRAQLGDVRVKAKLEELLESRLKNGQPQRPSKQSHYWDIPAWKSDIIRALACISEPNEAGARFLDYIARSDITQLKRDNEFLKSITLLPTTQAREVIKAYLAKAQEWQPPKHVKHNGEIFLEDVSETLRPIHETARIYDDRDIAEAVLKIMLRSENKDIIELWCWPCEVPQDFDGQSAELLRQGLACKNEQLRAWCVWQLRKTGYIFSEEEISRLLADESWKVRANTVMAGGLKTTKLVSNDPNPFVRWVASFIAIE